ncbi:regulator of chromosome condensation 1/beta-lactamase-inhibitor protein II [Russula aff. rugulosa BPL654]|nr:regulator of chromosome condensation 1/beta-lactamase-inhibitor protein II [Russula aff. rugulosa BPL654]
MPTRSRTQASINASKPKAPSRTASRTTVVSKSQSQSQESETSSKTSKSRNATRSKLSASDTTESPPPSLKRARSTTTLKEVNGLNGAAKAINKIKKADTVADVMPLPKKYRKAASETEPPINAVPEFPAKMVPPAQIFVWGTGNFGQFGLGPSFLDELSKPTRNTWVEEKIAQGVFGSGPGSGIVGVVAGGLHSLFIDENGTVWSCGVNDDAALGRITKDVPDPDNPGQFLNADLLTTFPHRLQTLVDDGFRALKVAAGDSISAAIGTEGELRVWGSFRANEGALGFSTGLTHQFIPKAALPNEQCVNQGQLGRKILERRKIHGTNPERVVLGSRGRRAVAIGAGSFHSFAVDEGGTVWGWGLNSAGQTGTGINHADSDSIVQTPRRVLGLDGIRIVEICGGDLHTLFLSDDGRVFACGRSDSAQLGLPVDHPAMVDTDHVVEPVHVPFPVSHEDDPVVHVSAGTRFNAAVTRDGALYAWGEGSQGEVGIVDQERVQTPTVVVRRSGGSWAAIDVSCGGQHSLGLFRKRVA